MYDAAAETLGFIDANALALRPDVDVVTKISTISSQLRVTLDALTSTWKHLVDASAAHYAQIERSMLGHEYTAEELAKMPVPPTEGTGGNSMDQVRHVLEMRKNYLPAKKIAAALKATA